MLPIVANLMFILKCEDDCVLLEASIQSVIGFIDHFVILDTTQCDSEYATRGHEIVHRLIPTHQLTYFVDTTIIAQGFAAARNLMLQKSLPECYIFWLDSDEIHFTSQLLELKEHILSTNRYDDISTYFHHFCLGSNYIERIERRINIYRKTETTHWVGQVHEHIVHTDEISDLNRKIFCSPYTYIHMGYVRPQDYVLSRWAMYAGFEGRDPKKALEEYPDGQCLDHRRSVLLPYFGEYPAALPKEWIQSKLLI
jgi:hypothetical protein